MTSLYLVALLIGVALLIAGLWRARKEGGEEAGRPGKPWIAEVGLPGTRAERSDEYVAGGGVGGAEGEGTAPGHPISANGGIGGAEGDDDAAGRRPPHAPAPSPLIFVARALVLFGAMGLALGAVWPEGPPLAVLALALLIGAGESALTWLGRLRAAGGGDGRQ
jgi:hypothetical protein